MPPSASTNRVTGRALRPIEDSRLRWSSYSVGYPTFRSCNSDPPAVRVSPVSTPITVTRPPAEDAYAWNAGNSTRHGPHHDAHRLTMAGRCSRASRTGAPPSKQPSVTSGIGCTTAPEAAGVGELDADGRPD